MIPKVIHFIFGLASDFGGKPFSFVHYMAVKSAFVCNPGYDIRFYCKYEPSGRHWEVARRYCRVIPVEPPLQTHGNGLHHVAHQADVMRLQYLFEEGGIYLDLDTITVRSFDELLGHDMVMGVQGRGQKVDGLCNAVMLARPGAAFLRRWRESYGDFRSRGRDAFWDEHSVQVPLRLARDFPGEITVLDRGAFFHPSAERQGIADLFIEDKQFPQAYCHHLWEGLAWNLVRQIDERNVWLVDTTYNRLARRYIGDDAARLEALRRQELQALTTAPMKLNLGCGANRRAGWVNVDAEAAASPDLQFDLTAAPWPLPDGSVGEAELSHVLEHVGNGFGTVMRELYRVCRDGARVHVKVPHPRHDWFLVDPTHNRPLLAESFRLLDAEHCKRLLTGGDTTTPLAVYWRVDFELVSSRLVAGVELRSLRRPRLLRSLSFPVLREWARRWLRRTTDDAPTRQLDFLSRHLSNMAGEVQVELRVRKAAGTADVTPPGAGPVALAQVLARR